MYLFVVSWLYAKAKKMETKDVEEELSKFILAYDNMCHLNGMRVHIALKYMTVFKVKTGQKCADRKHIQLFWSLWNPQNTKRSLFFKASVFYSPRE